MTDYELVGSIRRSLHAIRDHYEAALDGPRRGSSNGGRASKEPPLPVGVHVLDARRDCHSDLAHFTRVVLMGVTDINGETITTKVDGSDPLALAAFLDVWAERLEACDPIEAAGCDRDMATHAHRLRALALPDRRDWMLLGSCPLTFDGDEPCGGQVRAYPDTDRDPECATCGTQGVAKWWERAMFPDAETSRLVTAAELVLVVHREFGRVVKPATIRKWIQRGWIEASGQDPDGRTLYDRGAVAYALTRRGLMSGSVG